MLFEIGLRKLRRVRAKSNLEKVGQSPFQSQSNKCGQLNFQSQVSATPCYSTPLVHAHLCHFLFPLLIFFYINKFHVDRKYRESCDMFIYATHTKKIIHMVQWKSPIPTCSSVSGLNYWSCKHLYHDINSWDLMRDGRKITWEAWIMV